MTISEELLRALIPELNALVLNDFYDLIAKAQLEIVDIEKTEQGKKIFKLKSISDSRSFTGLWVLAQELRLCLDERKEKAESSLVYLFETHSKDIEQLMTELFGKHLSSPISQFLIRDFREKNPECRDYIETFLKKEIQVVERARSTCKLSTLLPIFEELRRDWVEKTVPKLKESGWNLTRQDDDIWIVDWPPWYSIETLPPFSEILGRLLPLDQSSQPIRECINLFTTSENKNSNSNFLEQWSAIREYLTSKGFVECSTSKFIEKTKNLKNRDYCLSYNKELTLRDHLHYSLVFEVLLKNLNLKKKLYPVFELSFCPWENCWCLGLASSIELKESKDINNFWYSVEEFKTLLSYIFDRFLTEKIEFVSPEEGEYLPRFSGALIYRLMVKNKVLGQFIIHRLEQFELRKKEVVSVSIKISYFS